MMRSMRPVSSLFRISRLSSFFRASQVRPELRSAVPGILRCFASKPQSHDNSTVDVAIIGGGAIGCSIADSLARMNTTLKVLVLERDPSYKIASSVLSVGSIRQQFSLKENVQMSMHGVEVIRELANDSSTDVSFDEGGYLFLSDTESGAAVLRENLVTQQAVGAEVGLVGGGDKLKKQFPWLQTDDIVEACFGARNEGWFDPYSLTRVFKKRAQQAGAKFVKGDVVAINSSKSSTGLDESTITNIVTEDENVFNCGIVVNAAGCWSQNLLTVALQGDSGRSAQILPVFPRRRQVFTVHSPVPLDNPGVPLVVDPSGIYFRREGSAERGLFLVGGMEKKLEDPNCEGTAEELQCDLDFFMDHLWPALATRVPAFENVKCVSEWAGFYDYNTFDQNALLGLIPGFRNFLCATGFSGHGIQQAPAVGRAIAELINYGEYRSLDLNLMNVDRVLEERRVLERNIV